ncbi:MAG TPA: HU family DNA-binding protein [Longimicrobiales bacterium]|nr:HU family DNA-binding protein [Longimicrobiales bacterium]
MNKAGLIEALADRTELSKKDARAAVEVLFHPERGLIADALKRGERVGIAGFGSFEVRERRERTGRNPRTGERIRVPGGKAPAFRAGKGLKAQVAR